MQPQTIERHTISVLVDNEAGVLARVIGLFSGRGYNIESLTVAEVDATEHLSRITIVTSGTAMIIEQIKNQLDRLVPVHTVNDLTVEGPHVERELALIKVESTGEHRVESLRIADIFRARVVDATIDSFVFEMTGLDREAQRLHQPDEAAGSGRRVAHRRRRDCARGGSPLEPGPNWRFAPGFHAKPVEAWKRLNSTDNRRGAVHWDSPPQQGMPEMRVYYDRDADVNLIKGKKVAVVGYGSQGHAHAQNLRDSGVKDVRVALRPGSAYGEEGERRRLQGHGAGRGREMGRHRHGAGARRAAGEALQRRPARQHEARARRSPSRHGLNIHFRLIEPRPDLDVFMIAPKGPGHTVRSEYLKGGGVPCLVAVAQNPSGNALEIGSPTPRAIGGGRSGVIETTFHEECETDLFGEQVVLCGGLTALIQAGYETLVEAGYAPEMAYFECLHEVKLIVDLIYEGGIANMRYSISNTAEYGDYTRGPRIITDETKKEMKRILDDIQSGRFARDWVRGMPGRPAELQGDAPPRRRAPDRGSRRQAARHDALDRQEQAGRQGEELRLGAAGRADGGQRRRSRSA